jgi:hypothetical protein
MQKYVISKLKESWRVNSSTYGIDNDHCSDVAVDGKIELVTPYKGFSLLDQRLVMKNMDEVFSTLGEARIECEKRNNEIINEPSCMECYDYIDNQNGSQTVFYMDDEGNESQITVW